MTLIVLTGASGSGKTTIAQAIESRFSGEIDVHYFDRIGVPSVDEMTAEYGSPAHWQYAMTVKWMERLANLAQSRPKVLFEGQMRLAFVVEATKPVGLGCRLLLVDCDDETRRHRLAVDRGQPELANPDMMNWAAYLRQEAIAANAEVLDTSAMSLDDSVQSVVDRFTK
jgi:dephospho-CoA kinase